jgi:hypothetical protein
MEFRMRVLDLTKEAPMGSIPKIIGVMLCGVTLYLGGPQTTLAINNYMEELQELRRDQSATQGTLLKEKETSRGTHTIEGEILDIGGNLYLVREQDGGLVVLHTDNNTQGTETVSRGDQIEAKVSDANNLTLVLSIRQLK